jgi:hypothetical protein
MADKTKCIAVIRFNDEYRIVSEGGAWGRYRFRVDAEGAAIRMAGDPGGGSRYELLVQDHFGELTPLKL